MRALVVGCAALTALLAGGEPAQAADKGHNLVRGEHLNKGDSISRIAYDGRVRLRMQDDGNLVLRFVPTGEVCFASNTAGRGHHATYQRDGNFVVVDGSGRAIWASNTVEDGGTTVDINSFGRLYAGNKNISGRTCP